MFKTLNFLIILPFCNTSEYSLFKSLSLGGTHFLLTHIIISVLLLGKLKNSYIFASETCALDIVGASFVREVQNGEIVIVENGELKSVKPFPKQKQRTCVFEYIYFVPFDVVNPWLKVKCIWYMVQHSENEK